MGTRCEGGREAVNCNFMYSGIVFHRVTRITGNREADLLVIV